MIKENEKTESLIHKYFCILEVNQENNQKYNTIYNKIKTSRLKKVFESYQNDVS